jgi:CRISPR system Cascade subunit CasD
MSTLLLRLAAPMQAWGTDSRFDTRKTDRIPSRSGVIGLLAAAMGLKRDADLAHLCTLSFGVRVDREGRLLRDFHTAKSAKSAYVTYRYYLSDAVFLVGLASDDTEYLRELDHALRHPVYPLFLGRRSCPPTLPLSLGIRETGLVETLENEPRLTSDKTPMRIVTDAVSGEQGTPIHDLPISFSPLRREYGFRAAVDRGYITPAEQDTPTTETAHDIFAELEGQPCI